MDENNKLLNVHDLINQVNSTLQNMNYSARYIKDLGYHFNNVEKFCDKNQISNYTPEVGSSYLYERYGIMAGFVSNQAPYAQRGINILNEYSATGNISLRIKHTNPIPDDLEKDINGYLDTLRHSYKSDSTIERHRSILANFVYYLSENDIDNSKEITGDIISAYIKLSLSKHSRHHTLDCVYIIKCFMKYLFDEGKNKLDISKFIIPINKTVIDRHLPTSISQENINKILNSIDRTSPVGKRDYAILLIASRLGLRTSDIRNLKPENFDWDNESLHLIQIKTGIPLSLPLPRDVGWAVIDYIKNGRPDCDCREIFVRGAAPYKPLSSYSHLLERYMKRAGVSYENMRHHGMHSLRSSLATHMLEQGVSLPNIQEVLGHADSGTVKAYVSVDKSQLMECALEVPGL